MSNNSNLDFVVLLIPYQLVPVNKAHVLLSHYRGLKIQGQYIQYA